MPELALSQCMGIRGGAVWAVMLILLVSCAATPAGPQRTPGSDLETPGGDAASPADAVPDVAAIADAYSGPDELGGLQFSMEHMEWLAFCAEAFGFTTTISRVAGAQPSLVTDIPAAQHERWVEVDQACTHEAVARGWFQPLPSSPEEREAEYERLLAVNECLTRLGYGTDPPSKDAFVESMDWNVYDRTPRGAPLSVHHSAGSNMPPEVREQLEIQAQCPAW